MVSEKRLSTGGVSRPGGLGNKKKIRSNEDCPEAKDEEGGLIFELDSDADQIDELKVMFDTAESVLDEPEKCIPLLRGIVHECHALESGPNAEEDKGEGTSQNSTETQEEQAVMPHNFPAPFYRIFGEALFNLAIMENPNDQKSDDRTEFLKAALCKLEEGLERHAKNMELLESRAVVLAALVAQGDDFSALKLPNGLSEVLTSKETVESKQKVLERIFDCRLESLNAKSAKKLIQIILSLFDDFLQDELEEEDVNVIIFKLSLINALAECDLELEEGDALLEEVESYLSKAIELGEEKFSIISSKPDEETFRERKGDFVYLLGEALMLLSSVKALQEDEEEEKKISEKAVAKFQQAKDEFGKELEPAIEEYIIQVKQDEDKEETGTEEDFTVIE